MRASDAAPRAAEYAAELIPVYPAAKEITSWQIADSVRVVAGRPGRPRTRCRARSGTGTACAGYADALRGIHRPVDGADVQRARNRLKWDEAFLLQVVLAQRRLAAAAYSATPRPRVERRPARRLRRPAAVRADRRPAAGRRVRSPTTWRSTTRCTGCCRARSAPARRSSRCGRCCRSSTAAGRRRCSRRPRCSRSSTTGRSPSSSGRWARPASSAAPSTATRVALLTGSLGAAARRRALLEAASGTAGIVIGTHALLEEQVQFADLGLVVIDEQHRFGVEQRDALRDKAGDGRPHLLVMTATPIPRTVAMTVFGDLDMSTLTELPAGRSPIATHVVPAAEKPHYLRAHLGADPGGGGSAAASATWSARGSATGPGERSGGRIPRTPARPIPPAGRRRATAGRRARRRSPSSTWPPSWNGARWPGCGWPSCTAGCRPTRRTR